MIKKRSRTGFTLLEMLLYISCSSLLSYFFCTYMWSLHQALHKNFSTSHHYLNLYRAHDMLIGSIQKMVSDSSRPMQMSSSSIMLSDKTGTKSWFVEEGKLILYTEDVDKKRSWKTVVAEDIEKLSFRSDCLPDGTVIALECSLASAKKTVRRYCIL